jgi:hypothetical protein
MEILTIEQMGGGGKAHAKARRREEGERIEGGGEGKGGAWMSPGGAPRIGVLLRVFAPSRDAKATSERSGGEEFLSRVKRPNQ